MATFSVSLFLPYTINFNVDNAAYPRTPAIPPSPAVRSSRAGSTGAPARNSLFSHTPPDTPPDKSRPETETLFPLTDPSSPALHFARPHDPRTLARTDAHTSEWGRSKTFNQPRFRRTSAPQPTILEYDETQHEEVSRRLSQIDGTSRPLEPPQGKPFPEEAEWTVEPAVQGNGGCTNALRAAAANDKLSNILWVGTLGFPTEPLSETLRNDIADHMENEYEALAVLTDDADFDGHYNRYCKTILWDSLNYQIPDNPRSKAYEDHSWVYYVKVNQAFADRVVQSYKHGDTIWVHDYHLLLVPSMIRKQLPDARIGFFLHTSFPSSEVFRCLAMRKDLLEGVLGANLVAFQAPEYANHFLQTCSRLLVVEATERGVQLDDRLVEVTAVPIGVNAKQFNAAREEAKVADWIKTISAKYKDKKLIVARDKLDAMRGVKQKLMAYEMFLNLASPEERAQVVLIQVATSTMSKNKALNNAIADIVNRINSRFSTLAHQPVIFLQQDIDFSQYIALLTVADTLLVTPLRDGMNLTCHEYLLCQDGAMSMKKHGPLILSEFTGSASLFGERGGNLAVNPWDYAQMARAIRRALNMTDEEKAKRYSSLMKYVMEHDGVHWVLELQARLSRAYDDHQLRNKMSVPRLSLAHLSEQYQRSSSRLFILGYEGTLVTPGPLSRSSQSLQRVINSLSDLLLASDRNTVYVSSSGTRYDLEQTFRQLPGLGLIAENGCFVRPHDGQDWIDLVNVERVSHNKQGVETVLAYYRDHIEGSWIEERSCGFTLHYASAEDVEGAERQAGECAAHISDVCMEQRMKAVPIEKAVVVEPLGVSKVEAAKWVMRYFQKLAGLSERHAHELEGNTASKQASAARGRAASFSRSGVGSWGQSQNRNVMTSPASNIRTPLQVMQDRTAALALTPPQSSPEIAAMNDPSSDSSSPALSIGGSHNQAKDSASNNVGQAVPDFLMVAGNDREDEDVYHWANILSHAEAVEHVISVCVGLRNTEASCTLTQGATGLLATLQRLAKL